MLIQYVRDKNRHPIGVVVAIPTQEKGDYCIGWSLCHVKKDGKRLDRFNKGLGLKIAIDRAIKRGRMWEQGVVPHSIYPHVKAMDYRAKRYFQNVKH